MFVKGIRKGIGTSVRKGVCKNVFVDLRLGKSIDQCIYIYIYIYICIHIIYIYSIGEYGNV